MEKYWTLKRTIIMALLSILIGLSSFSATVIRYEDTKPSPTSEQHSEKYLQQN